MRLRKRLGEFAGPMLMFLQQFIGADLIRQVHGKKQIAVNNRIIGRERHGLLLRDARFIDAAQHLDRAGQIAKVSATKGPLQAQWPAGSLRWPARSNRHQAARFPDANTNRHRRVFKAIARCKASTAAWNSRSSPNA